MIMSSTVSNRRGKRVIRKAKVNSKFTCPNNIYVFLRWFCVSLPHGMWIHGYKMREMGGLQHKLYLRSYASNIIIKFSPLEYKIKARHVCQYFIACLQQYYFYNHEYDKLHSTIRTIFIS